MNYSGFIVLHRAALESYLFQMPGDQFKVAMVILLRANWKEGEVWRGTQRVKVPRGSFICSRETLAKTAKVGIRTVRTTIRNLTNAGFLTSKATNHHTVVSVTNYGRYQDVGHEGDQQGDQRPTSARPAGDQRVTTIEQGNKGTREQERRVSDVSDADPPPPKAKRAKREPHPEAVRIARRLVASIIKRQPESKPAREPEASANRWAQDIDKLNRLDHRAWPTIEDIAGWSQRDPFWQGNILSGATLRAQFDKLEAAKRKAVTGGRGTSAQPDTEYVEIGARRR